METNPKLDNDNFNPNDIPRCGSCNLIPLFDLKNENDIPIIIHECQNGHKGKFNLSEYEQIRGKNSIFNKKCNDCQKENSFFCFKCNVFICKDCCQKHGDGNKHMLFPTVKFDSFCDKHSNSFSSYCLNCKNNLCCFCVNEHYNHNIINFSEINFTDEKIKELIDKLNELKNSIIKLDEIKNIIIKEIDKLKENNNKEIKFIFDLFKTFEFEMKNKNMNYNVFQNLKNFQNKLVINKFDFIEKISIKSQNFIDFLKNIKCSKDFKSLQFKKDIKSHSDMIYHIAQLKDGRIASCSKDKKLIIYDNKTFEPQIEINNIHNKEIFSFTQLEDGKIITCSADNTMKLIQLEKDKNKYSVVQSLEQHQGYVVKVIEFFKNELISISNDSNIKFWKKDNDNFNCIKSIKFQNSQNYAIGILKLNNQEFVTVDNGDGKLKFWNYQYYSLTKEFEENISSNWNSTQLCLLNQNNFIFAHSKIYLFDIKSKNLIKKFDINTYSVFQCLDETIILNLKNHLIKYELKDNEMKKIDEIETNNSDTVFAIAELKDGTIIYSHQNLISVWN